MKREVILFFAAVIVVALSISLVAAATSCTVAAGKFRLTASDVDGTMARVLVIGEGTGSFTDATSVMVDCNAENINPQPREKSVKARLTLSQSTLAFRADCYYPLPEVDTTYTVGASILPDNVPCVQAVGKEKVVVVGLGTGGNLTKTECGTANAPVCETEEKCKAPYVHDGYGKCAACPKGTTFKEGKCVKEGSGEGGRKEGSNDSTSGLLCLDGSKPVNGKCPPRKGQEKSCPGGSAYDAKKGECVKKAKPAPIKEETDLPKLPDEERDHVGITLNKKYTFIGIPFEDAEFAENNCEDAVLYTHNAEENAFTKTTWDALLANNAYEGKGILVKLTRESPCKLVFRGNYKDEQRFLLKKGWNFISPQTKAFLSAKNRRSDCTFLSPFVYHEGKYHKETVMKPGRGYLVKVKGDCALSTKEYLDLPELPN